MDGRQFDDLLRSLSQSRRTILGGMAAAAAGVLGFTQADAKKKKKKPCAKRCKSGCCTSKFGKCIQPAQQNSTQCGTNGEICRSNCGGEACGAGCEACCANGSCIDVSDISNEQCGTGGEACFSCPPGQSCNAPGPGCCARHGDTCRTNGLPCCSSIFETCGPDNTCCSETLGSCDDTSDCCDQERDICENGSCVRRSGELCSGGPQPFLCATPLTCSPTFLTCCAHNGARCEIDADCCEDEDICESNGQHKICKRKHREACDNTIVCEDAYPICDGPPQGQRCLRCASPEIETGTSEVCCLFDHSCSAANGGVGACCVHEHCCVPDPESELECPATEHGTPSC